jgi:hypothetical protein
MMRAPSNLLGFTNLVLLLGLLAIAATTAQLDVAANVSASGFFTSSSTEEIIHKADKDVLANNSFILNNGSSTIITNLRQITMAFSYDKIVSKCNHSLDVIRCRSKCYTDAVILAMKAIEKTENVTKEEVNKAIDAAKAGDFEAARVAVAKAQAAAVEANQMSDFFQLISNALVRRLRSHTVTDLELNHDNDEYVDQGHMFAKKANDEAQKAFKAVKKAAEANEQAFAMITDLFLN